MKDGSAEWQMNKVAKRFRSASAERRLLVRTADGALPRLVALATNAEPPNVSSLDEFIRSMDLFQSGSPSPFDELLASVGGGPGDRPKFLPPPARFMVRTARVSRPHRPTKRSYDYFEDLNAALAARRSSTDSPY